MRGYHSLETQFAIMKEHTDLENYLQTRYVYQSPDANQKIYNKALEDVAEEFGLDLGVDRNEN